MKKDEEVKEQEPGTNGEPGESCEPEGVEVETQAPKNKEAEYLAGWQRANADFENFKNQAKKDQGEMRKYVAAGVIEDMIPVLDNLHMAASHVPEAEKSSPWVAGITYIERQFEEALAKYGVSVIAVKSGDALDAKLHEPMSEVSGEESEGSTQVVDQVIQNGYQLYERVIRPARVSVKWSVPK